MPESTPIAEAIATGDITVKPLIGPPIPEAINDPSTNTTETESDTDPVATEKTENDVLRTEVEEAIRIWAQKASKNKLTFGLLLLN